LDVIPEVEAYNLSQCSPGSAPRRRIDPTQLYLPAEVTDRLSLLRTEENSHRGTLSFDGRRMLCDGLQSARSKVGTGLGRVIKRSLRPWNAFTKVERVPHMVTSLSYGPKATSNDES
jgi:hypothetical protein